MTFEFNDIYLDLKENAPIGEIIKWRNYMLRIWNINQIAGGNLLRDLNYSSWLMDAPRLSDDELNAVEKKWKNLVDEISELGKKTSENEILTNNNI